MLQSRAVDVSFDPHPIPHRANFSKGDTRLGHSEWARVHSKEQNAFLGVTVGAEIEFVGTPGVKQRIVDMRYGRVEGKLLDRAGQRRCRLNQFF